ncbi:discoidin domain-containing protein [Kitasatospora cineracea]|uniref:discoidin domain-containing protein n=1 Tax=Kitasatospora cineracea TaxID=88074 RepID=UPI00381C345D
MGKDLIVGRPMTGRAFLAARRGGAQASGVRGPVQGRAFGVIGDIMDVMDLLKFLAGLGGSGPGVDLEELLRDHKELLEQIRNGQGDILDKIGGLEGLLELIGGGVGDIADKIDELERAEEDRHEEIKDELDRLLAEQNRNTQQILNAVAGVSNQVAGLWSDMNAWFALTLDELDGMSRQLDAIQQRLAVLEALLHTVLAELAELHDRVDWSAIITLIAEHEHRVSYCNATALDITVTPLDAGDGTRAPQIQVDTEALKEWARSVADEVNGLPYSLFAMHRVLTGDTLLGKPLMDVFCRLLAHKSEITYGDAARYFTKLAATQTQGYAVLTKARQALALPPVDYGALFEERLAVQVDSVKRTLRNVYSASEWNDAAGSPEIIELRPLEVNNLTEEVKPDRYFVAGGNEVITGIFPTINRTAEAGLHFWVANPIPGTSEVDARSHKGLNKFHDGSKYEFSDLATVTIKAHPVTGQPWRFLSYYPVTYVFDPAYVLVGFKFSTLNGALLCEPLVALYDAEAGTTSWDPATRTGLWKASPAELGEPADADLGDPNIEWTKREEHQLFFKYILLQNFEVGLKDPAMVRGFRLTLEPAIGDSTRVSTGYLDDRWQQETGLPRPQGDKLCYEPFTLPVPEPEPEPEPEPQPEPHLALGKPVTVSSETQPGSSRYTVDGFAQATWSTDSSFPQWWEVDLGEVTEFGQIKLFGSVFEKTVHCSVSGSTDGSQYVEITPPARYQLVGPDDYRTVSIPMPPGTATRYVRLTFQQATTRRLIGLREVQILPG